MELRFAVVEDRLPDAQRLEGLLRLAFGNGYILVCDHFESGDAFLQAFPSRAYQAVFLDICMEAPTASTQPAPCAAPTRTCRWSS